MEEWHNGINSMDKIRKYWLQFSSWFQRLSIAKKFWFGLFVFFLLIGSWPLSLIIAVIWFVVDKSNEVKQQKLQQRVDQAKAFLDPIISSRTLPVVSVEVNLQKDEQCVYMEDNVQLAEERKVRIGRGSGASFRVTKGVWVHSFSGRNISQEQIKRVDTGSLFITTKRVIYLGKMHNKNIKYDDILATHQYTGAIEISVSRNGKNEYFIVKNSLLIKGILTLAPYGDKLKDLKKIDVQYQLN